MIIQRFSTKMTVKKVCYFYSFLLFLSFHDNMPEKSVFEHKLFYFVYNMYVRLVSEKCMTQLGRKYIFILINRTVAIDR